MTKVENRLLKKEAWEEVDLVHPWIFLTCSLEEEEECREKEEVKM